MNIKNKLKKILYLFKKKVSKERKLQLNETNNDEHKDPYLVSLSTHNGNVRANNEDNYSINGKHKKIDVNIQSVDDTSYNDGLLLEVCDGMGGEEDGEIASFTAVELSRELYKAFNNSDSVQYNEIINKYVKKSNQRICQILESRDRNRSGSTFALVYIKNKTVYTYSLGDSRVYIFKDNKLIQITEDHTLAMRKYKANIYTKEELISSADSHKLTLFLGVDNKGRGLNAEVYEPFEIVSGCKILICSDGLYDMCSEDEIKNILTNTEKNTAEALLNKALENGGIDNITCIVAELIG